MKKKGNLVLDTNTNIMIAVIFLALVIIAVGFIYWDKIEVIISNFIPETESSSEGGDQILDGSGETVSYLSLLLTATGEGINKQSTAEEKDGYYSSMSKIDFYKGIFSNYFIISVYLNSNKIIQATSLKSSIQESLDPDPKSNPIRLLFASGENNYIDFVYDAKQGKVLFGNSNTGRLFSWDSFSSDTKTITNLYSSNGNLISRSMSTKSFEFSYPEFAKLSLKDYSDINTILSSNGLANFVSSVISVVDKEEEYKVSSLHLLLGDDQYLYYKGQSFTVVPASTLELKRNFLYNILSEGRPYYLNSWKSGGELSDSKKQEIIYSCLDNNVWKECSKSINVFYLTYSDASSTQDSSSVQVNCSGFLVSECGENLDSCYWDFNENTCKSLSSLYSDSSRVFYNLETSESPSKVVYSKNGEIWVAQYDLTPKNYCSSALSTGKTCYSI